MERHSYTFEWGNAQFSGHNDTSEAAARRAQMRKIRELAESDRASAHFPRQRGDHGRG
jgi:hypothetical protein